MAEMKIGSEIFNVVVEGPDDAPALLLSNSLATDLHMWDPQISALTKSFRVIRYDSRGHGGSVADDGPYSIEQLGTDALNILDALGIAKTHFMGLSLGGMVGMWIMTHHGDRIEKAVLANTGAYLGNSDFWNMRIRTARSEGMNTLVAGTVERWFSREYAEKSPESIAKVAEMVRTTPPLGYASCAAAIRDMDQREAIRSIACPVLVIVGTKDPATPPAMGGLIAGSIENARIIDVDAAHLSNIEAETAFTRAVVSFLSSPARKTSGKTAGKKASAKKAPAKKANTGKAKAPAKKTAGKKSAPAKKAAPKKPASKKPAPKAAAKKTGRKAAGKKTTAKKTTARKAVARKAVAKKTTVKKLAARKAVAKKPAGKKPAGKKPAGKKPAGKKPAGKAAKRSTKKSASKTRR